MEAFARFLVAEHLLTEESLAALRADADAAVNRAAEDATAKPQPEPEDVLQNVYSPALDPASAAFDTEGSPAFSGEPTTMVDLINACLKDEMARDGRIAIWGEDVADATRGEVLSECKGKGGVFKVTAGLQKAYGTASSTPRSPRRASWGAPSAGPRAG